MYYVFDTQIFFIINSVSVFSVSDQTNHRSFVIESIREGLFFYFQGIQDCTGIVQRFKWLPPNQHRWLSSTKLRILVQYIS